MPIYPKSISSQPYPLPSTPKQPGAATNAANQQAPAPQSPAPSQQNVGQPIGQPSAVQQYLQQTQQQIQNNIQQQQQVQQANQAPGSTGPGGAAKNNTTHQTQQTSNLASYFKEANVTTQAATTSHLQQAAAEKIYQLHQKVIRGEVAVPVGKLREMKLMLKYVKQYFPGFDEEEFDEDDWKELAAEYSGLPSVLQWLRRKSREKHGF